MENYFIKLGGNDDKAPVLRYSLPDPTSYHFKNIIPFDVPVEYIKPEHLIQEDDTSIPVDIPRINPNDYVAINKSLFDRIRSLNLNRVIDQTVSKDYIPSESLFFRKQTGETLTKKEQLDLQKLETLLSSGVLHYKMIEGLYDFQGVKPIITKNDSQFTPKVMVYESYQLSNYLGDYGAGRVIKVHGLGPGEKNKFTVKTFKKSTELRNEGASILDSNSETASRDFEMTFEAENSQKYNSYEADIKNSERGEGSVNVVGIFGGKASYQKAGEWGTRSSRDDFAKTIGSTVNKHSSKSSSKRNIEVTFSSEVSTEESLETSLERNVENVNVSKTLNLVFRQMVQEFFSVLHLLDIKIALYTGRKDGYPQYRVTEIDEFINYYFIEDEAIREEVKLKILKEFYYVFDFEDSPVQFLEKVTDFELPDDTPTELGFSGATEYWRVKRGVKRTIEDLSENIEIPGVVVNVEKITMRTEGIVLDAFLGLGEALDEYSKGLQKEAVREMRLKNNLKKQEVNKLKLINALIEDGKLDDIRVFQETFDCHCKCMCYKSCQSSTNTKKGDES